MAPLGSKGDERPQAPATAGLLERLRAGEEEACRELMVTYGGRMLAVARRLLRREQDAEDVVQEAFLSAFRSLAGFEARSDLGSWLHRIVTNAALMRIRADGRRDDRGLDELLPRYLEGGHHVDPPARWADLPDHEAGRRELQGLVRERIGKLPENYRIPLVLRDIEGWSMQRVADELEITYLAAKMRVHRARQALRTLLDPDMAEET